MTGFVKRHADHLLHFTPDRYGGTWRLECLPGGEHFTADIEEWSGTADELEASGVAVDRTTCWVHTWLSEGQPEEWVASDVWPEDGPWPVVCYFDHGLRVEYVPAASPDRRPHSRACGPTAHDHGVACHRNCPTCHGRPT